MERKINYYLKSLDKINSIKEEYKDRKPKLLLHSCCGPCACFPLTFLCPIFDVTILYNNSNIYPSEEYFRRLEELKKLLGELLDNRFDFTGKQRHHFYASTFKHYLDELSKVNDKIGAVKLSLQYNNTLKVMEPRLQYVSITSTPDTNTAPQVKYSSDEDRISKMARNDDGTPMTF